MNGRSTSQLSVAEVLRGSVDAVAAVDGSGWPEARVGRLRACVRLALASMGGPWWPAPAWLDERRPLGLAAAEVERIALGHAVEEGDERADGLVHASDQALGFARRASRVAPRQERWTVRGVLAIVLLTSLIGVAQYISRPDDLARGKPWRTSSTWAVCEPQRGRCGSLVSLMLFSTLEEDSPWFELDLEKPTSFSSMTIVNRKDDGRQDRAVPLVVEVSDDRTSWRPIARRTEVFATWRVDFPEQTARFIRLRVDRRSWLHLEAVRVHR